MNGPGLVERSHEQKAEGMGCHLRLGYEVRGFCLPGPVTLPLRDTSGPILGLLQGGTRGKELRTASSH